MKLNWKMVSVLLLLCGTINVFPVLSDSVYDDWAYQKEIEIQENSGEELFDFQVSIFLDSSNFDISKAKAYGSDLRFVAEGEELSYWIEDWNVEKKEAKIWVKVPIIPAEGVVKIVMYYGNEDANATSDGDATFKFFDDFESGNFERWDESSGWSTSSDARQGGSSAYATGIGSELSKSLNMSEGVLEGYFKFDETDEYHYPYMPTFDVPRSYLLTTKPDGHFGYWSASGGDIHQNLPEDELYEADKWYDVRVDFSFPEMKYWVYIEGELKTPSGLDLPNGTIIERLIHLNARYYGSGGMHVDVSRVRKYASAEPTVIMNSEAAGKSVDAVVVDENLTEGGVKIESYATKVTDIAFNSATLHPKLRQFVY